MGEDDLVSVSHDSGAEDVARVQGNAIIGADSSNREVYDAVLVIGGDSEEVFLGFVSVGFEKPIDFFVVTADRFRFSAKAHIGEFLFREVKVI